MLMGGGVVLLISTFLDWFSVSGGGFSVGASAWETDAFGLLGIYCALIGLVIGGGMAASTFGNVSLPDQVLGFNHDQIHLILSGFALLITIGFLVRGDAGIGLWLGLLASAVMLAGSIMDIKGDSAPAAPPAQF
jgi:hypothetical protein